MLSTAIKRMGREIPQRRRKFPAAVTALRRHERLTAIAIRQQLLSSGAAGVVRQPPK